MRLPATEPTRLPGTVFRAFLRTALPESVDIPAFAARMGVPPEKLESSEPVTLANLRELWREVEHLTCDPWIGLQVAVGLPLELFGPFYRLLASCPDFRSVLELIRAYVEVVHSGLRVILRVEGELAAVEVCRDTRDIGRAEVDFTGAFAWRLAKSLLPSLVLTEVQLPHPCAVSGRAVYEGVFGCPVDFGADRFRAHFPANTLAETMPAANEQALRELEEWTRGVQRQLERVPDFSQLRAAYRRAITAGAFDLASVAASIQFEPGRLRSLLRARRTSHSEELELARRQLASERLRAGLHSVEEIATELGFSQQSAFARAFRRWTGLSPSSYSRRYRRSQARTIWVKRTP